MRNLWEVQVHFISLTVCRSDSWVYQMKYQLNNISFHYYWPETKHPFLFCTLFRIPSIVSEVFYRLWSNHTASLTLISVSCREGVWRWLEYLGILREMKPDITGWIIVKVLGPCQQQKKLHLWLFNTNNLFSHQCVSFYFLVRDQTDVVCCHWHMRSDLLPSTHTNSALM